MNPTLKTTPNLSLGRSGSLLHYLKSIRLFSNLADEDIAPFQKAVQIRSYKKEKIIYLQEEDATFFYVIYSGWIKLFRTMPEGQEVIIGMLTTGHIFGDDAVFEPGLHACSAQVIVDVKLLKIPANVLKKYLLLNPSLALHLFTSISKQHRQHMANLAFDKMLSAPQRIGCFLLRLSVSQSIDAGASFNLPYDKTLIAHTLGMNGATFSRALTLLKHEAGTRVNGSGVEIDSTQKLAEYVYGSASWVWP